MAIQINITPEMEKWSSAAAVDAARPVSDLPLACLNNGGAQRCVGGLIRAPGPPPRETHTGDVPNVEDDSSPDPAAAADS
jgi:hypothetical protein